MAEEIVYKVRLDTSDVASKTAEMENGFDRLGKAIQGAFLFGGIGTDAAKRFDSIWNRKNSSLRKWFTEEGLKELREHQKRDFITANLIGDIREKRERLLPLVRERLRAKLGANWETAGVSNVNIPSVENPAPIVENPAPIVEPIMSDEEKSALARKIGLIRLARERLRSKLGADWESKGVSNTNPDNPNSMDYKDKRSRFDKWSENAYAHIKSLVPKGAYRDVIGRVQNMGNLGKTLGLFMAGILAVTAAMFVLKKVISLLFSPFKALADEVFRFYRMRHQMGGMNRGELSKMGWAGYIMGGKPEDNYALMARIAGERASLLWGGNGGKYISAARRFGVDISGSGRGGLATENEWMRNIAIRMMELDPEGKLALANEAGLSREQMWLVSNGVKYFDWASSRRTLAQMAWGDMLGKDIYTENFQNESQNFWTDFGMFMETMKEFLGSIGEIVLPIINAILEVLTGIFSIINLFLKPIATLVGKIFSLLNLSFWTNMNNMESSIPNYGKYDMGMIRESSHPHTNSNIKTGDIYIQSDAANTDDAAKELASKFVNSIGNTSVFEFAVGSNIQGAA